MDGDDNNEYYRKLISKEIHVPLFERLIIIIIFVERYLILTITGTTTGKITNGEKWGDDSFPYKMSTEKHVHLKIVS